MTTVAMTRANYRLMPREDYLRLYHLLSRTRFLNERIGVLNSIEKKIHGSALLSKGQEHITIGAVFALEKLGIADRSWIGISHRDQGVFVWKGPEFEFELVKNHLMKQTSWTKGRDPNIHLGSREHRIIPFGVSHMGASVPVAVGVAEALREVEWLKIKDKSKRPVVIVFFGDGAAQQGCVHEGMNWAAASNAEIEEHEREKLEPFFDAVSQETNRVRGAPVVFVLNNNEYSITTRSRDEHGNSHLARRADGYANMVGVDVHEKDPVAVYHAVKSAVHRAQRLEGSTLVVCHAYRLGGHNETEDREYMDQEELVVARAKDPVRIYRNFLESLAIRKADLANATKLVEVPMFTKDELDALDANNRKEVEEVVQRALKEPDPIPPKEKGHALLFTPHTYSRTELAPDVEKKKMKYRVAIGYALEQALKFNSRVVIFGEDVEDPRGGILALTKGLSSTFGTHRVFTTPISEEGILGNAHGRALYGQKPICEIQFSPFITSGMTQPAYAIPTSFYHNGINLPLIIVMPFGVVGPGGSGNEHSHCNEAWFYHQHGLKIVFPSDAYEAAGLLYGALEDPNPVMFYSQIRAHNDHEFDREVPVEPFVIPLGKANVKRQGGDLTVVTYGAAAVQAAMNTATVLEREKKISLEVIDLRTIVPLDMETVMRSVMKTGRVVILHEASVTGGVGESIHSKILSSKAASYIRTDPPGVVLGADDRPVDGAYVLEWDRLPFKEVPANFVNPTDDEDLKRLFSQELFNITLECMKF